MSRPILANAGIESPRLEFDGDENVLSNLDVETERSCWLMGLFVWQEVQGCRLCCWQLQDSAEACYKTPWCEAMRIDSSTH